MYGFSNRLEKVDERINKPRDRSKENIYTKAQGDKKEKIQNEA